MKIGEYVRTKYGIAKIIDILESNFINLKTGVHYIDLEYKLDKYIIPNYEENINLCSKEDIIKCEEEPIDLIEIGDYVNGKEITFIRPADICGDEKLDYQHIYYRGIDYRELEEIYRDKIKSIVTKEQFTSMEYRIGE